MRRERTGEREREYDSERELVRTPASLPAELLLRTAEGVATWPNAIERSARAVRGILPFDVNSNDTVVHQFENRALSQPNHAFLLYRAQRFTYREANDLANRYAEAYKRLGLAKGDVVALVMENRPELYWHYLGLSKLGIVVSLINTHAIGKPLAHAIRICGPKRIVVGSEALSSFEAIRETLADLESVPVDVDLEPDQPAPARYSLWGDRVPATSAGATRSRPRCRRSATWPRTSTRAERPGRPRPRARVKHHRLFRAGLVWGGIAFRFSILTTCSTSRCRLYHGNAMILGTSSAITYGVTIAVARKFSASAFWDDCRRVIARPIFLYIGELCRYLHNAPRKPSDRDHSVRAISGNGLRPDIWVGFQERFGIERIAEFYGATEGNVITINVGKTPGSVGKMLPGHALARWDQTREDFVRDAKGRLVRCWPGEVGVLLGEISNTASFDGYEDRSATERKIVRGAFHPDDAWFNTGDLLRTDWLRNLFFADRLGDTFRWKGENVSTFEVQEQISAWPAVREVNVYGVAVGGTEGRAGMAALVLAEGTTFDPASFKAHVDSLLPKYARPVFVRIDATLEVTGTLKLKKRDLQEQGIDPAKVKSPLFVRHPATDEYVPLDEATHDDLRAGRVRL